MADVINDEAVETDMDATVDEAFNLFSHFAVKWNRLLLHIHAIPNYTTKMQY